MALNKQRQVVLAKNFPNSAINGSNTVPTSDTVFCATLSANFTNFSTHERTNIVGYKGNQGSVMLYQEAEIGIGIEFAPHATAGTEPAYHSLLMACGLASTTTSSAAIYTPFDADGHFLGMVYMVSGARQSLPVLRGNFVITMNTDEVPMIDFTFKGRVVDQLSGTLGVSGGAPTGYETPVSVKAGSTIVNLGGTQLPCSKFSFDPGNSVVTTSTTKGAEPSIESRSGNVKLSIKAEDTTLATHVNRARNNEMVSLTVNHGSPRTMALNIPQLQYKSASLSFEGDTGFIDIELSVVPQTAQSDFSLML